MEEKGGGGRMEPGRRQREGQRRKEDGGRDAPQHWYLLVRRNMLFSRKSGIEKLESAVQRDSDILPLGGHGGEPEGGAAGGQGAFWGPTPKPEVRRVGEKADLWLEDLPFWRRKEDWGWERERQRERDRERQSREGRREGAALPKHQGVRQRKPSGRASARLAAVQLCAHWSGRAHLWGLGAHRCTVSLQH